MTFVSDGPITQRQAQILQLISEGLTDRQIGERLRIGEQTVKSHVRLLLFRMDARTRAHAVAKACREGTLT